MEGAGAIQLDSVIIAHGVVSMESMECMSTPFLEKKSRPPLEGRDNSLIGGLLPAFLVLRHSAQFVRVAELLAPSAAWVSRTASAQATSLLKVLG